MRTKTYTQTEYEKIINQSPEKQMLDLIQEGGNQSNPELEKHLLLGKKLSTFRK